MELNESIDQIKKQAEEFGMRLKDEARSKQNAVWRNNTKEISEYSHSYFGFIREGEASSQSYSDISLVFFPNYENPSQLLMSLAVGTEGFKNDYELALQPGLRRSFFKLLPLDNHISFCKRLFSDISNRADFVQDGFSIDKYLQYLLIGVVVNINDKSDWDIINGWLARYAQIRGWDSNKKIKNAVSKAIDKARVKEINNNEIEIERNTGMSMALWGKQDEMSFTYRGNGFLYHMVRIMTGTLLEIGMHKRKPEDIADILSSGLREKAGELAPAKGLTLMEVYY